MSLYTATFRIGGTKFEAVAGSPQGVRRQIRRACQMHGADTKGITELKFFGSTTSTNGHKFDFVVVDEARHITPLTELFKLVDEKKAEIARAFYLETLATP